MAFVLSVAGNRLLNRKQIFGYTSRTKIITKYYAFIFRVNTSLDQTEAKAHGLVHDSYLEFQRAFDTLKQKNFCHQIAGCLTVTDGWI